MGMFANVTIETKSGKMLRAAFSSLDGQDDQIDAGAAPFGLSEDEFQEIKHIDELFEYIAQWFSNALFLDEINILDYKLTTSDEKIAEIRALDFAEVKLLSVGSSISFPWGARPWEALEEYNYETGKYLSDWDENPNESF